MITRQSSGSMNTIVEKTKWQSQGNIEDIFSYKMELGPRITAGDQGYLCNP
jgi:hypothetical protein